MNKSFLFLLLLSIVLVNCSNHDNPAFTKIDIHGHEVNLINYSELEESPPVKLSDIATDFRFIPLETNTECLFSYAYYHIYDKYIIVVNPYEKILLFDGEGKFIRQLCNVGHGPQEFQNAVTTVDEKNDVLYVGDDSKSYLMSWDLSNGEYLGDIPRVYNGRLKNIIFTKNKTILCAPCVGHSEAGNYYIFEQDTKGNLIREIKAPPKEGWADSQDKLLHFNGSSYNYIPIDKDTAYHISDSVLTPYWTINFGTNNRNLNDKPGGKSFKYKFESNRFFIGYISTITKVETMGSGTRTFNKTENIFIDKKTNQVFLNEEFTNDFIGEKKTYLSQINILSNNTVYQAKSAISLVEHSEKVIADPQADPELKLKLSTLLSQIDIEDNPVLIVGKLRR